MDEECATGDFESVADAGEWVRKFNLQNGRPLRVLHVGNIANNAYLNAKFLRSVGVDVHVVCYDYDHVMSTPEWEEVELVHWHEDDFLPSYSEDDLRGYQRPFWFVSGSLRSCTAQIAALWGERTPVFRELWLSTLNRISSLSTKLFGPLVSRALHLLLTDPRLFLYRGLHRLGGIAERWLPNRIMRRWRALNIKAQRALIPEIHKDESRWLIDEFDRAFPKRPDRLSAEDVAPYQAVASYFSDMFRRYDIVQCYATEPIYALLSGKRPFVTFEHGTLRHFTTDDAPLHRLTALSYRKSDHTFVTNGDCLAYARALGIPNFSPALHPIDVAQHRQDFGGSVQKLRKEFDADVVLFCPTRHDWDIKGTDQFIRALPIFKERYSGRVKMILVDWGLQVDESRNLLKDLRCESDVIWRRSMCRITMIKHMHASDVVLDQMVLPVFGSTAPQAIAAGKPVIASYVPGETAWLMPEPAPILSAFSPVEVASAIEKTLEPDWRRDYADRARHWIDTYHHPDRVIMDHLSVYRRVLHGHRI